MKTLLAIFIFVVAVVFLLAGCAGPKFVRECNELASACSAMYNICAAQKIACDVQHTALTTCNADNDRLMKTLTETK